MQNDGTEEKAVVLSRPHPFKCVRCVEKAAQNLVGELFRKSSGKVGADLVHDRGRAGNEVLQQRLDAVAVADLLRSAIDVSPLDAGWMYRDPCALETEIDGHLAFWWGVRIQR